MLSFLPETASRMAKSLDSFCHGCIKHRGAELEHLAYISPVNLQGCAKNGFRSPDKPSLRKGLEELVAGSLL